MANDAIKKMSIRVFDEEESAFVDDERDIGIEAQNAIVSFDGDGEIIEDINDPEVTVNSTKTVAKVLKDESNKIMPIEKGGTGQTTAAAARNALGLGNTTGALPVANGGTGKTSITSGTVLVGNGTNTPTERTIDTTSGGTANSNALITSGAVKSKIMALETSISDKVGDYTFLQTASTQTEVINIPSNAKELFIIGAAASDATYVMMQCVVPISCAKRYESTNYKWIFNNYDGTTRYYITLYMQNISNNKINVTWSSTLYPPSIFYR